MNNQLKVEVQCPFCGECYKRHARESLDRIADEPFNHNEYVKELNEVFS